MAQELPDDEKIQLLTRRTAAARACLVNEKNALKARLDVPARLRGSLRAHPSGWLLGSLASGFAGSLFVRLLAAGTRRKKRGGFLFSLLGLALTAVRPLVKVWAARQVKNVVTGQSAGFPGERFLNRRSEPPHPI